eukprot:146650_1
MKGNSTSHTAETTMTTPKMIARMGYGDSSPIPYNRTHHRFKITMSPLSKRKLQLCAFMVRGGKVITPIRFCGHASPHLHYFNFSSLDSMSTRHAEVGTINGLTHKQRQLRLLKRTTLIVVRFSQKNIENSFEIYLSNSKPCKQCIKILQGLQLKAVIYVNQNGQLIKRKPKDICDCVDSGGSGARKTKLK